MSEAFPSGSRALYIVRPHGEDKDIIIDATVFARTTSGNYPIGSGAGLTIATPEELRPDTALERIALELEKPGGDESGDGLT